MFFFVGLLIGLNLAIRIALGETRELQARGQTNAKGKVRITPRDLAAILRRGGVFLLGFVAAGYSLDLLFNTTIVSLLG